MTQSRFWKIVVSLISLLIFVIVYGAIGIPLTYPEPKIKYEAYFTECSAELIKYVTEHNGLSRNSTMIKESHSKESDIIISANPYYSLDESWEKVMIGYSPIVAFFPKQTTNEGKDRNDFFIKKTSSGNDCLNINMANIINVFAENDSSLTTLESLGFKRHGSDFVKLAIPASDSIYHDIILEEIMRLIINDGPLDNDSIRLYQEKYNNIIKNCVELRNPSIGLVKDNNSYIILAPEYIMKDVVSSYIYPVYWANSLSTPINLWYKKNLDPEIKDNLNAYALEISQADMMFRKSGFRNNSIPDRTSYQCHVSDRVNPTFIDSEDYIGLQSIKNWT